MDFPQGGGQLDVGEFRQALEPTRIDGGEVDALEVLEVGQRENVVLLFRELAVEPCEALVGNARQVGVVAPCGGIAVAVGLVVVGHVLQHFLEPIVRGLYDAGHEAVLVFHP